MSRLRFPASDLAGMTLVIDVTDSAGTKTTLSKAIVFKSPKKKTKPKKS